MSKKVTATILFVDIMDSMEIANYWDTKKYNEFLNEFQRIMLMGIELYKKGIKKVQLVGDELVVFYSSKDVAEDIVNAMLLAHMLKIHWYVSYTNIKRIKEGKKHFDLGIGINTGQTIKEYRPFRKKVEKFVRRRKTFEGLPISLAKRIEGFSRQGKYSKIMVGHHTMAELKKLHHDYEFEFRGLQKLKGLAQMTPIFELKSCFSQEAETLARFDDLRWAIRQLECIKVFDPSNIWLLMTLIDIYDNKKKYKKVEELCREAIAIEDQVANVHLTLGVSLGEQKKHEEALQCFNKAISLKSNYWGAYIGKTSCLIFLGLYDECIKIGSDTIKSIPKYLRNEYCDSLYYNIAAAYARKGSISKAISNIKKAVEIGGSETLKSLRKDEDGDFCNLYENTEFIKVRKGKLKAKRKKQKKQK